MTTQVADAVRPAIILIDTEAESLFELADAAQGKSQLSAELLLQELERAETVERGAIPADVVTMHSRVEFVDERSGEKHEVELVYPGEADSGLKRISVLTPIGAGLIGMRTGATIEWPDRSGTVRRLRVEQVRQPEQPA